MKEKRLYDFSKLRGRMRELNKTNKDMADMLNVSGTTFSYKLNNIRPFTNDELDLIIENLGILPFEINQYFFTKIVEKK